MKHIMYLCLLVSYLVACQSDETEPVSTSAPSVTSDVTYTVLQDLDIAYAQGLAHDEFSEVPFAIPLYLDVYYPGQYVDQPSGLYVDSWWRIYRW